MVRTLRARTRLATLTVIGICLFNVLLAHLKLAFIPLAFRGHSNLHRSRSESSKVQRRFFNFDSLGGGSGGSIEAGRAFDAFRKSFPEAVARGDYLGDAIDEGVIKNRFSSLASLLNSETLASKLVQLEPILLVRDPSGISATLNWLRGQEGSDEQGLADEVVMKNPLVLTVSLSEYERTKPSLSSLGQVATIVEVSRPFGGQAAVSFLITAGFIAFLLVLRFVIYGTGSTQSLVSIVTSPLTSNLPPLQSPKDFLEGYGINMASLVAIIPLSQVAQAAMKKLPASQETK
eukprot:TRINITY_DN3241_c2_g1_i1.p1 TRINITY_DN3241_c2_g1~~TRINITY_DN3241_c2_g1_i1.p1  ORF type:complete len:290 (+),score=37.01 TRINITY_DN3241_c2_g1_i1:80-949(+)